MASSTCRVHGPKATPLKEEGIRSTSYQEGQSTAKPTLMASSTCRGAKLTPLKGKGIGSTSNQEGDKQGETRIPCVYLVFDDWSLGHTIREVILSPGSAVSDPACVKPPPPVVMRLEARHGLPQHFTSAFGTKIVAMHNRNFESNCILIGSFATMFDICEQSLTFCHGHFYPYRPIYFSIGNKLFCLSEGCFEMLIWEARCSSRRCQVCSPEKSWQELSDPPFERFDITSYVVHPQSRTFIVSTKMDDTEATFAYDTEDHTWQQLGSWALPFSGRGHFDQHHNILLGLSKEPDTLGHLYYCNMPICGQDRLSSKLLKEKLFSQDPAERHVGATLVHLGSSEFSSRYGLVQCVSIEDDSAGQELKVEGDSAEIIPCFLYRLTTFDLNPLSGGLTTGKSRRVQYYKVPKGTSLPFLEDPVAFWM